jgi:hypothetical protein
MIVPVSLRLTRGAAEITCRIYLVSADGTTSPMAFTAAQAYALTAGASAGWSLGAVSINGTALEAVEEVVFSWNVTPMLIGGSGLVFDTFSAIEAIQPSIQITARSIDEFLSWGFTGAAQGATDSTIQIDDCLEGGVRGSTPIICSLDEGLVRTGTLTRQNPQAATHSIIYTPTYDGTALPLAWSGLS